MRLGSCGKFYARCSYNQSARLATRLSSGVHKTSLRPRLQVADSKWLDWAEKLVNKHLIFEPGFTPTIRIAGDLPQEPSWSKL